MGTVAHVRCYATRIPKAFKSKIKVATKESQNAGNHFLLKRFGCVEKVRTSQATLFLTRTGITQRQTDPAPDYKHLNAGYEHVRTLLPEQQTNSMQVLLREVSW
jgi:hypothetical protein